MKRVNVEFSDSVYGTLKKLADKKGKSVSEVLRDAVALEDWFLGIKEDSESHLIIERNGRLHELIER
jgi:hypothetical protein